MKGGVFQVEGKEKKKNHDFNWVVGLQKQREEKRTEGLIKQKAVTKGLVSPAAERVILFYV